MVLYLYVTNLNFAVIFFLSPWDLLIYLFCVC